MNGYSYALIGAAMEVHRALGPGYAESVYEEAMCIELTRQGIAFVRQHRFEIAYLGRAAGEGRLDLWVDGKPILELKAVEMLAPVHQQQVLACLRATDHELGLLINFNVAVLKDGVHRIIHTRHPSSPSRPLPPSASLR